MGYAAWSVAMFWQIFGTPVSAWLGLSVEWRIVIGMMASGGALTIILRGFKRVRETAEIRGLVLDGKWKRVISFRILAPIWAANFATIFSLIFLLGLGGDVVLLEVYVLAAYAAWWAFLCYAMRLSFPGKLPGEAVAALASFGIALAFTIVLLPFTDPGVGLLWGAVVVTWVASAFYALRQPVLVWGAHLAD